MFEDEYKKTLTQQSKSLKNQRNAASNSFIVKHTEKIIAVLFVLIICSTILAIRNTSFLIGIIIFSFGGIYVLVVAGNSIKENAKYYKITKEMRAKIWKKTVEAKARQYGYSYDRFILYLLVYHKCSALRNFAVNVVSLGYTVFIVLLTSGSEGNLESYIVGIVVAIVTGGLGNQLVDFLSNDRYFESLKNDLVLF